MTYPKCEKCGHSRSYHRALRDRVVSMSGKRMFFRWLIVGYGACRVKRCECGEFVKEAAA